MSAHAWVDEMCNDLEEEFDLSGRQAFRVVSLIRKFNSDPFYEEVTGENGTEHWIEMKSIFSKSCR